MPFLLPNTSGLFREIKRAKGKNPSRITDVVVFYLDENIVGFHPPPRFHCPGFLSQIPKMRSASYGNAFATLREFLSKLGVCCFVIFSFFCAFVLLRKISHSFATPRTQCERVFLYRALAREGWGERKQPVKHDSSERGSMSKAEM